MDILRFITAGNVDDGKSTLIGRLLYDTGNIKTDVLQTITGEDTINLAHITDGLRAERQQGITIDVAYKYFTTADRKFIISDAPGHFQYTKNLVTGASGADVMILLVDAVTGITAQTKRHALVASFLRKKQIVVAINKIDAVGYSQAIYTSVCDTFSNIAAHLSLPGITYIPISALLGDNVINLSTNTPWYRGASLLQYLELCPPDQPINNIFRFIVQYVTKGNGIQYCAGKVVAGFVCAGDTVVIYPDGCTAVVRMIMNGFQDTDIAHAGQSVCLYIECTQAISRGSTISESNIIPQVNNTMDVNVCWLDEEPLVPGKEYYLQMNSCNTICCINEIISKTSVDTLENLPGGVTLEMNEFARIKIKTKDSLAFDSFQHIPPTGRGIIIDMETYYTSGAFVIL
jgi:sulfate adenylyltransferase large subunit